MARGDTHEHENSNVFSEQRVYYEPDDLDRLPKARSQMLLDRLSTTFLFNLQFLQSSFPLLPPGDYQYEWNI